MFELRQHSAGLNCGRWDYIFSLIKTLRADPNAVCPDRYSFFWVCTNLENYILSSPCAFKREICFARDFQMSFLANCGCV